MSSIRLINPISRLLGWRRGYLEQANACCWNNDISNNTLIAKRSDVSKQPTSVLENATDDWRENPEQVGEVIDTICCAFETVHLSQLPPVLRKTHLALLTYLQAPPQQRSQDRLIHNVQQVIEREQQRSEAAHIRDMRKTNERGLM